MSIILKVCEPRAIVLPPASSTEEKERAGLILIPGENSVTEGYFALIEKNPGVVMLLESGALKNLGTGEAKPLSEGLDAYTVPEARKVIAKLNDSRALERFRESTTKKGILEAINERLKALESTEVE